MSDKQAKLLILLASIFLVFSGFILYIVFQKQGYSNVNSNSIINYNINDYIETEPLIYNNYDDVYSNINVSKIKFKNIDITLTDNFMESENEIIQYIDKYYVEIKKNGSYNKNNTVISFIKTQINSTILSVYYNIQFNINDEIRNFVITTNIDLKTNKILSTDDLLNKYNYTKNYISQKLFDEIVLINDNDVVIDKITNISLNKNDILRKKNEYLERIVSEFDNIIEMYIENNSLTISYDTKTIKELFFICNDNSEIILKYLK